MDSVFVEGEFYALIVCSMLAPLGIYAYLMRENSISRGRVLQFGCLMILLSGLDVFLFQRLRELARVSVSALDDKIFVSEVSAALYLLPAIFAGIGINIVSSVLINHLTEAETRFDRDQRSS